MRRKFWGFRIPASVLMTNSLIRKVAPHAHLLMRVCLVRMKKWEGSVAESVFSITVAFTDTRLCLPSRLSP